jgi:hypothetical protein
MDEIDLKTLMIHVERIVRPVRAMERRKLQMRWELLAHLQAALEEERSGGREAPTAWEMARGRLGGPEDLTRELQKSVPFLERLAVWPRWVAWPRSSIGKWRSQLDRDLEMGFHGMMWWQQLLFLLALGMLALGWWLLAARHWQGIGPLTWTSLWRLWAGGLLGCVLQAAMCILALRILIAGAQPAGRRRLVMCGAGVTALVVAVRAVMLLAWGAGPATDLVWMPAVGVALTVVLAWLGKFLRPGLRDLGEWLTLDIAA